MGRSIDLIDVVVAVRVAESAVVVTVSGGRGVAGVGSVGGVGSSVRADASNIVPGRVLFTKNIDRLYIYRIDIS